jgi:hypothetical protein
MIKSKGLDEEYRKVTITLGEEQENFLDEIRRKIRKNGGSALARTEVIRTAIEVLKCLKVDNLNLSGIKNEFELFEKIKKSL